MKKHTLFQGALIAALTTSAIVVPTAQAAEKFTDVDYTQEYGAAVKDLAVRGIIKGYADGTFKPFADVTRGQAAKIVANVLHLDTKNVEDPKFTDVKPSDDYYGAIAALANKGALLGLADGSFGVNQAITREQLAQMLTAAYQLESNEVDDLPFTDIVKYSEAYYAIAPLFENQITKGITPTKFGLKETVKRSQLAVFIQRMEAMQAKRVTQTFTAKDLDSNFIEAYATDNQSIDGEHESFRMYQTNNEVKIEALREGSGYIMLMGYNIDNEENFEMIEMMKYKVTVSKVDGKLQMNCQQSDEVTPGIAMLLEEDLGFDPKNIQLTTAGGHAVSEKVYSYQPVNFEGWEEKMIPKGGSYELKLLQAGDYIATLSNGKGQSVRVGIHAESSGYDIYTTSAVEINSAFISMSDIGFTVKDIKVEQYTGARYDHQIIDAELSPGGVTIKGVAKEDSLFSIRLTGTKGEKLYVHGMIYEVSGVTTMYYEFATEEQMKNTPFY